MGGDISLLCLSIMERVESRVEVERVLQEGFFDKVLEYMDSEDIALATRASKVIQALHRHANSEQRHLIDSRLSVSSPHKHRLIDLMQRLSMSDNSMLFQEIKAELQNDDELSVANALQTLREVRKFKLVDFFSCAPLSVHFRLLRTMEYLSKS